MISIRIMYEIQDFIYAEMSPRAKHYARFNGTSQHLLQILKESQTNLTFIASEKIQNDKKLCSFINEEGYSFVIKDGDKVEWMYENTLRPCDKLAQAAVLDIENTVYTRPGWFSSEYGIGTKIKYKKKHIGRIAAASAVIVLIFSYTIHRCISL